jgi:hypothetical protein
MATLPSRAVTAGKIIDKTLGVLERNAVPAVIFVVALTALSAPVTWYGVGSLQPMRLLGGQLLIAAAGIVCAYFLLIAMLRRTGLYSRIEGDTFLPYIGLSLLYTLGFLAGLIAIILPAFFIMARWSIAQPLLVGGGRGVMASLGESWERTKDKEFQILGAWLALIVLPVIILIAARSFFGQEALTGIVISQIASSTLSVVTLAWNVAIYGLIVGAPATAADNAAPATS